MIARLALAAILVASVPIIAVTQAEAAPRDGKRSERSWKNSSNYDQGKRRKAHKSAKRKSKSTSRKYSRYEEKHLRHNRKKATRHGKRRWSRRSCHAAAKKRRGYGKRLWGIAGKAYGRNACTRAMYECRRELRHRKSKGRNPYAKCVIISRT